MLQKVALRLLLISCRSVLCWAIKFYLIVCKCTPKSLIIFIFILQGVHLTFQYFLQRVYFFQSAILWSILRNVWYSFFFHSKQVKLQNVTFNAMRIYNLSIDLNFNFCLNIFIKLWDIFKSLNCHSKWFKYNWWYT